MNRYKLGLMPTPGSQKDSHPDNGGVRGTEVPGLPGNRISHYATRAAIDVYNRTPQGNLGGLSPYDAMHKRGMQTNTVGEINPTVESVFSRSRSPVQAFRFSSTVAESKPAHSSLSVFDDVEHFRDEGGEKLAEDLEEETTNDGRKGIEDLKQELSSLRSQVARVSVEQTRAGSNYLLGNETDVRVQAGDFHYYQTSHQDVSEVVPERFRWGRESSSVLKNITVRESKRSKSRSFDQDYQR
jgi:hypothetical protein